MADLPSVEKALQNVLAVYGFDEPPAAIVDALRIVIDTRDAHWQARVQELEQAAEARERQVQEVLRKRINSFNKTLLSSTLEHIARELGIDLGEEG